MGGGGGHNAFIRGIGSHCKSITRGYFIYFINKDFIQNLSTSKINF